MSESFNSEQKQYLEGFFTGARQRMGQPFLGQNAEGQFTDQPEEAVYGTPVDELSKEEVLKHEKNGLDIFDTIIADHEAGQFPQGGDMFRYKFYGLFHVAPAQDAFMLRLRIPGCALQAHQMDGLADIADQHGGGYADVTTRGNLQIREIQPKSTIPVLQALDEIGLTSKGSGADNIRNVTASPTSGYDPEEVLDVLPYAKAMHYYILQNRDLYGLPRKFNISFDSGSPVSVCADTNDIGFLATRRKEDGEIGFRVQLCGITGHRQFASDCGLFLAPSQAIPVAAAMIRVFLENGDRTNRKKARLKYLVDDWGVEKFLEETEKKLTFPLPRLALDDCEPRTPTRKHGHIGVYRQQQEGLNFVGVVVPVGRLPSDRMRALADLSRRYGRGDIRLTVWQNLMIPWVADEDVEALKQELVKIGLHYRSTSVSGGLVACTGNTGCRYASTNTKGQAVELGRYLDEELDLDQPINIHLTGCPHSCAQHYIGDIGLLGTKVKDGDTSHEGYHVVLGGGVDDCQNIAREMVSSVAFEDLKPLLKSILQTYLEHRQDRETFWQFNRRHDEETLKELYGLTVSA
ncbi:MAG: NirA family protein [Opitutales bacterium]|nr:NirA family protein [Opitutales bacterium]